MTEERPPTYEELLAERTQLRAEIGHAQEALLIAARELTILHAEMVRLKKTGGPRKLDPKATDAFRRPYR